MIAAVVALSLVSCASLGVSISLEERAHQFWKAKLAGDFEKAYTYLSAGSRDVVSKSRFEAVVRKGSGMWKTFSVQGVKCESEDVCTVNISLTYRFRGMDIETSIPDVWIFREGAWYNAK
ncbi:MAG: hypothetical protein R8M38_00065 [Mariprofundaceae bacterium]